LEAYCRLSFAADYLLNFVFDWMNIR